jgi:hypothetical protein
MFDQVGRSYIDGLRPAAAFLSAITVAICTALPVARADSPSYTARFLTPGISAISAAAMNEAGDVVGTSTTGSGAWISRAGAPAVLLPLPPGAQYAFAAYINDAGVIVGAVGPTVYPEYGAKAAAWIPDGASGYTIREFGTLPGHASSYATAVNNLGDIIGYSSNGTFRYPVLFSAPGGIQDLSSTGIFDPTDINDSRVLVNHAFNHERMDLDTMIAEGLGVPPGPPSYSASWVQAINESGQVAGSAIYACCPDCDRVAARFTDGVGWEVFSGCGRSNGASFINDLGDVVMRLNVAPYVRFQGIGTFRIEDLIVEDVGHWYVINGAGPINNSRQMAIPATNSVTGESGMILLTPVALAGDLNGDWAVNVADVAVVVDVLLGLDTAPATVERCDLNGDGVADGLDLQPFTQLLIGS